MFRVGDKVKIKKKIVRSKVFLLDEMKKFIKSNNYVMEIREIRESIHNGVSFRAVGCPFIFSVDIIEESPLSIMCREIKEEL